MIDNVYVQDEVVNVENVEIGDIIVVVRNGSRNLIGKNAQIKEKMYKTVIGAFMTGVRYQEPEFINALLSSNKFNEEIEKNLGATINQITTGNFKNMNFCFPKNHKEEERIGKIFFNLDNLITLHQCKLIEKLSVNFLVCTFFNDSWEQCKLGEVFNFERPDLYMVSNDNYDEVGIPVLTANKAFILGYKNENGEYKKGDCIIFDDFTLDCKYVGFPFKVNSSAIKILKSNDKYDLKFSYYLLTQADILMQGHARHYISVVQPTEVFVPNIREQLKISKMFSMIDHLITLHQRECIINGGEMKQINKNTLLVDYYEQWINVYKEGAIRNVTMKKYRLTLLWLKKITPKLKLCKLDRIEYQNILNTYALEHERQTTMDFHHQLKGAILDAVDEGYIERDPTRKVIIKGKTPRAKKIKYLNQYELHTLLKNLDLSHGVNFDWLILIIAKTGMRFSEAIALTPKDFDFSHQTLSINKTWDYKESGSFQPTKNKSSVRKIQIDWMVVSQFSTLIKDLPENEPIFVKKPIYNSTINDILERHCKKNKIPVITVHGLRHTHASLLLFAGVSIASVAQRLGHASMTTTQKTYLHIIQELENKDVDLVMRSLSGLC